LISPPAVVAPIAPEKELHGAVRLQLVAVLASSPTPDIHVREICACAGAAASNGTASPMMASESATLRMVESPVGLINWR